MEKRANIALITGASSGIGESFVKYVSEDKGIYGMGPIDEIWIVARRESRLQDLKERLSDDRIRVVPCDLSSSVDVISDLLSREDPQIGLLINCAGLGKKGAVADRPASDLKDTLDVNCTSLSVLTRICLPYMVSKSEPFTRKNGPRIINIAFDQGIIHHHAEGDDEEHAHAEQARREEAETQGKILTTQPALSSSALSVDGLALILPLFLHQLFPFCLIIVSFRNFLHILLRVVYTTPRLKTSAAFES